MFVLYPNEKGVDTINITAGNKSIQIFLGTVLAHLRDVGAQKELSIWIYTNNYSNIQYIEPMPILTYAPESGLFSVYINIDTMQVMVMAPDNFLYKANRYEWFIINDHSSISVNENITTGIDKNKTTSQIAYDSESETISSIIAYPSKSLLPSLDDIKNYLTDKYSDPDPAQTDDKHNKVLINILILITVIIFTIIATIVVPKNYP